MLIVRMCVLTHRETLQGDLETAESRLDDAFATIEKEKTARYLRT